MNFKSLLKGCQTYIAQSDIDHKDFFNRTKGDKILDDLRDSILLRYSGDLKSAFMKSTETSSDEFDKTVMTQEHFLKLSKQMIGDKYSTREIEVIYRSLVSSKPLTFKRFTKVFL